MRAARFFSQFATLLARSPGETELLDDAEGRRAKFTLFLALGLVLGGIFIPLFLHKMSAWSGFQLGVSVPRTYWKVLPAAGGACAEVAGGDCPANSENPALWSSPFTRGDADHGDRVNSLREKDFWVGARFDKELLAKAGRLEATQLVLGRFNAHYRIWVDGRYVLSGEGRAESGPVVIPIEAARFQSDKPLDVAVKLYHSYGHYAPDLLNSMAGGEGFATRQDVNVYLGLMSFWSLTRPLSFFTAYIFLSILFLYLWLSSRQDQEYFYMSMHLLTSAFMQLRLLDVIDVTKNLDLHFGLSFLLEIYKAGFGMFLGLAFARSRRGFFKWGVPLLLFVPLLFLPFFEDPIAQFHAYSWVRLWLVPAFYTVGALACLIQAAHLVSRGKQGSYLPTRIGRLLFFGLTMFVFAFFYSSYARSFTVAPTASQTLSLWLGVEHYVLVLFLGYIAASEIRHQAELFYRTPVSEYHQLQPLPEKVAGVLLVVDLKSSEAFYRQRAERDDAANLVSVWRSHMYASASRHGGVVIYKKGDEVAILFDRARLANPEANALRAIEEASKASLLLERQYRDQGLLPRGAIGFRFRAAVVEGELKPIWEEVGTSREPAWTDGDQSPVFERVAELFQIERGVRAAADRTVAVIPKTISEIALRERPALHGRVEAQLPSDVEVYLPEAAA